MKEAHLTSDALHENSAEGIVPSVEELSRTIDLRMLVRRELLTSSAQAAPPTRVEAVHRVAQLINDYDPMLLETDVYLAFRLRQLELLELIRDKQLEQALLFAEVFVQYSLCRLLLGFWFGIGFFGFTKFALFTQTLRDKVERMPQLLPELERTLALLAFENPADAPSHFGDLYGFCIH